MSDQQNVQKDDISNTTLGAQSNSVSGDTQGNGQGQTQSQDIDVLIGEHYVPSALERKKSLMMYMIRGILLSLSQQKASRYEQFHLKQALGRWTMFFLLLIPSLVLMFIPWVKVLPMLAYIALFAVWIIFFMQAWHGSYTSFSKNSSFLPVFAGFGGWVLSIFDLTLTTPGE